MRALLEYAVWADPPFARVVGWHFVAPISLCQRPLPLRALAEIYRIVTRKTLEAGGGGASNTPGGGEKIVLGNASAAPAKKGCC
jgi:hypothetical protein